MEKESYHVKLSEGRRVVLPTKVCEKLNLGVGDAVIVEINAGEVRLRSWKDVLQETQSYLKKKLPLGASLVEDLIAERRAESLHE